MSPTQIVLMVLAIVGGIGLLNAVIWIPIVRRLRRMPDELRREIAGSKERLLRGPEPAVYRGASADGYPGLKGNGVVALTDRRLILRLAIGKGAEVPLDRIEEVRQDKWFLSSYAGGKMHVIMRLRGGGEVGFFAPDPTGWANTLRAHIRAAAPR